MKSPPTEWKIGKSWKEEEKEKNPLSWKEEKKEKKQFT